MFSWHAPPSSGDDSDYRKVWLTCYRSLRTETDQDYLGDVHQFMSGVESSVGPNSDHKGGGGGG